MALTGMNYIGKSGSAAGTVRFQAVDPATGNELTPAFAEASWNEVEAAVEKASSAFRSFSRTSGEQRAQFLEAIADELVALDAVLLDRCAEETGLPETRLTGERGRTVNQLRMFAGLIREGSWVDPRIETALPDRTPVPKPDVRSILRPLGPVAVFGSSNFPLAFSVAGGDTASALAAGCTVVVKAHPAHPGTCELVASAILKAVDTCGLPDGTFSLVHGKSTDVGMALVQHPLLKAVGFTGSFAGGKALFDAASKRPEPIPVFAEMGSTNPVFILPRAVAERRKNVAADLAASVTVGVGQFCTNPGLVFVLASDAATEFTGALAEHLSHAPAGVMLTEGIRKNFAAGLRRLAGVRGVTASIDDAGRDSVEVRPVLLRTDVRSFLSASELQDEVFGPSTLAVTAGHKEELLQAAESLHGHLTATVHGTEEDLDEYADLLGILEQKVGRVIINGYPTGVEVCNAMVHGGPFPATTDSRGTSVGTAAILRFVRPVCYQNMPDHMLPDELKNANPKNVWRLVNGERTQRRVSR